jgi:hypothetical protein
MGFFVSGAEPGGGDVSVDLSRDEALVAEELLDGADVGAAIEKVSGEAVAERMGRGAKVEAGLLKIL